MEFMDDEQIDLKLYTDITAVIYDETIESQVDNGELKEEAN